MKCPRCNVKLTDGTYEGESASHCQSCGGILTKQKSLSRILERLSIDIFEAIDINTPIPAVPDVGRVGECPECHGEMDNYGYMGSSKVIIDCCKKCNSLWIDALEIAVMAKMYVVSSKRSQYLQNTSYQGSDLFGVHTYTQAVTNAFFLGFMLG